MSRYPTPYQRTAQAALQIKHWGKKYPNVLVRLFVQEAYYTHRSKEKREAYTKWLREHPVDHVVESKEVALYFGLDIVPLSYATLEEDAKDFKAFVEPQEVEYKQNTVSASKDSFTIEDINEAVDRMPDDAFYAGYCSIDELVKQLLEGEHHDR